MNEWMDGFISQCMADVPWGRYRRRAEAELRDHMQTMRRDLTEAEVLRHMGDPERLRKEYYVAWKQTPLCRVNWLASGTIVIWGLMCLTTGVAGCLEYMEGLWPALPEVLVRIVTIFLIPFPLGALFLRACFREERRRAWWVTLGLLAAWASFNSYLIVMGIAIEEINQYPEQLHGNSMLAELLERDPWLVPYLWLTFVGCLVLGWLFGRNMERRCTPA